MDNRLRVGVITTTHGIKGEVKVFPTTDDVNRFKELKGCFLVKDGREIPVTCESCKFFKNMVILKFKEFDNITRLRVTGITIYWLTGRTPWSFPRMNFSCAILWTQMYMTRIISWLEGSLIYLRHQRLISL